MDSEKIGQIIKDIRNKNNLTQKDFADKYNVTYQAVSKWENGKNLPDITLLQQICKDFDINFSELVGDNKKKINKLYYIIPTIIIIVIAIILFVNNNSSFEFKTITTNCKDFDVTGSIAYDSKKSSIYISNINYCGKEDNTIYKKIECSLYEKKNNIKQEISKEEYNENITLQDYLKTFSLTVDSYESSCKVYNDDSLYLEIKAYNSDNEMKIFEIPLSLDKTCK